MNVKDKINKAAWNLIESIRDTTTRAVMTLVSSKQIEMKPEHLQKLITVINTTIESGFQNGTRVFERTVDEQFKAINASAGTQEKKEVKGSSKKS